MKKLESDKLNLGSGQYKKKGFINLDFVGDTNPDVVWDLDKFPYPFPDSKFEIVTAYHLIEHVKDPFKTMVEIHRIMKDGGKLIIRTPHFSRGFTHPDHKRGYDVSFPLYFDKRYKAFYYGVSFGLKSMKLSWFAQPYMKKQVLSPFMYYSGTILGGIINFFANLSPYFCSRIWCYWVGGFEEIEYVFIKKND